MLIDEKNKGEKIGLKDLKSKMVVIISDFTEDQIDIQTNGNKEIKTLNYMNRIILMLKKKFYGN